MLSPDECADRETRLVAQITAGLSPEAIQAAAAAWPDSPKRFWQIVRIHAPVLTVPLVVSMMSRGAAYPLAQAPGMTPALAIDVVTWCLQSPIAPDAMDSDGTWRSIVCACLMQHGASDAMVAAVRPLCDAMLAARAAALANETLYHWGPESLRDTIVAEALLRLPTVTPDDLRTLHRVFPQLGTVQVHYASRVRCQLLYHPLCPADVVSAIIREAEIDQPRMLTPWMQALADNRLVASRSAYRRRASAVWSRTYNPFPGPFYHPWVKLTSNIPDARAFAEAVRTEILPHPQRLDDFIKVFPDQLTRWPADALRTALTTVTEPAHRAALLEALGTLGMPLATPRPVPSC